MEAGVNGAHASHVARSARIGTEQGKGARARWSEMARQTQGAQTAAARACLRGAHLLKGLGGELPPRQLAHMAKADAATCWKRNCERALRLEASAARLHAHCSLAATIAQPTAISSAMTTCQRMGAWGTGGAQACSAEKDSGSRHHATLAAGGCDEGHFPPITERCLQLGRAADWCMHPLSSAPLRARPLRAGRPTQRAEGNTRRRVHWFHMHALVRTAVRPSQARPHR